MKRKDIARSMGKGPNGRALCSCGCARECEPPRRSWFSDACVHEWKIRNWPPYARAEIKNRDKGVCAVCHVDTNAIQAPLLRGCPVDQPDLYAIASEIGYQSPYSGQNRVSLQLDIYPDVQAAYDVALWLYQEIYFDWLDFIRQYKEWMKAEGWPVGSHLWEADHIKPVVEGGGQCGLDNLRTLCIRCHKRATAELARRRAEARKLAKDQSAGVLTLNLNTETAA